MKKIVSFFDRARQRTQGDSGDSSRGGGARGGDANGSYHEFREAVTAVYKSVREDYANGLKSPNKFSSKETPEKRRAESVRISMAATKVTEMRASWSAEKYHQELLVGVPAGKCQELAVAAMDRAVQKGLAAAIWGFGNARSNHGFAVIARTESELGRLKSSKNFSSSEWKHILIADPWMGLCCPASEYVALAMRKMEKWEKDGKRIPGREPGAWSSPTKPDWLDALKGMKSAADIGNPRNRPFVPEVAPGSTEAGSVLQQQPSTDNGHTESTAPEDAHIQAPEDDPMHGGASADGSSVAEAGPERDELLQPSRPRRDELRDSMDQSVGGEHPDLQSVTKDLHDTERDRHARHLDQSITGGGRARAPVEHTGAPNGDIADTSGPAAAPLRPRDRLWQQLAQPYDPDQRSAYIQGVSTAIEEIASTSAEECRAAFMDNPKALVQFTRLLQRQNPTHAGSTAELAHVAAIALGMAIDQQLSTPDGAQKLAAQLTSRQPVDLPSDVLGKGPHSVLSLCQLGSHRLELAPWSDMVLRTIPGHVPTLKDATICVAPEKNQSLKKAMAQNPPCAPTAQRPMGHASLQAAHASLTEQLAVEAEGDAARRARRAHWLSLPVEQRVAIDPAEAQRRREEAAKQEADKAFSKYWLEKSIQGNNEVAAERRAHKQAADDFLRDRQEEDNEQYGLQKDRNRARLGEQSMESVTQTYALASARQKEREAAEAEQRHQAALPRPTPDERNRRAVQAPSVAEAAPSLPGTSRPSYTSRPLGASGPSPADGALVQPRSEASLVPTLSVNDEGQVGLKARSESNSSLFITPLQTPSDQPGTRIIGAVRPPAPPSQLTTGPSSSTRVDQRPVLTHVGHHPATGIPRVQFRNDYGVPAAVASESGFSIQRSNGDKVEVHPIAPEARSLEERDRSR